MNQKVIKLKQEREKNARRIAVLQARNEKIDEDIVLIENTEILGLVREYAVSVDELAELIRSAKKAPRYERCETSEENGDDQLEE